MTAVDSVESMKSVVLGGVKDARFARAAGRRAAPVLDVASARRWELGIGSLGDP